MPFLPRPYQLPLITIHTNDIKKPSSRNKRRLKKQKSKNHFLISLVRIFEKKKTCEHRKEVTRNWNAVSMSHHPISRTVHKKSHNFFKVNFWIIKFFWKLFDFNWKRPPINVIVQVESEKNWWTFYDITKPMNSIQREAKKTPKKVKSMSNGFLISACYEHDCSAEILNHLGFFGFGCGSSTGSAW